MQLCDNSHSFKQLSGVRVIQGNYLKDEILHFLSSVTYLLFDNVNKK